MVAVRRPAGRGRGAGPDRRDLGGRRAAPRPRRGRRLLLRPAEGVRRRWRALAGAAEPGRDRARRGARRRRRAAGSRPSSRCRRRSRTRARTRPTTRPRSRPCFSSPIRSSGCSAGGGLEWCVGRTERLVAGPLRMGGGAPISRRRSSPTRPSARWSSGRSTSTRPSTPRRWPRPAGERDRRRRALPQARPQPAADRDVPDRRPRRRRGSHRLHRLGDRERRRGEAT